MVWNFIGVYIINRTLHDRLQIRNFSSRVEKYFSTLEEKFRISAWPCNILYIFGSVSQNSLIQTVKCFLFIRQDFSSQFLRCVDHIYLIFLQGKVSFFARASVTPLGIFVVFCSVTASTKKKWIFRFY